jgi:FkbH-like protein
VNDILSLVRRRLEGQRGTPLATRVYQNASYVAEVAAARFWLRDCDVVGPWVRAMHGKPHVENEGRIEVGARTRLYSSFAPVELRATAGGALLIGDECSINYGTTLQATREVRIGKKVDIGPYCIVSDTETPGAEGTSAETKPIEIGDGVWLASRVTVLPGARIGEGSVITAGSVVEGEIPKGVVAGGSPARVLRRLDANGAAPAESAPVAKAAAPEAPVVPAAVKAPAHRGLLISDFTIDELARCLTDDPSEPIVAADVAPFGQVIPTLMTPPPEGVDFAVVWTRPESVAPSFARLLEYDTADDAAILAEVDQFASLVVQGLASYRFGVVPTWTVPTWHRGLGLADGRAGGVMRALYMMNARLMERLAQAPNVYVLNADHWLAAGKGAYSPKLWYMGKVPFAPGVFALAAADIKAAIGGLTGRARKLLVVDLDDTLWGGIVGDVGWENLRLGGHDSIGESFVDFQRAVKSLKRRGIVLAVVSKNEESVALEAMRSHPEMVLREDDFVAHRINWQDKARNIADLTASLNLGLQSVVFIDDNPFERTRVREALPEVFVPDWPEDKLLYTSALRALRCFDAPALSAEDASRTEMYGAEKKRDELRAQVGSVEDWLRSLEIQVRAEPLSPVNLARTVQLLNKTNQMNLSTRRLTEQELSLWVKHPDRDLWAISVSDRLGDAGLTGIVSTEATDSGVNVVDFVLSCRVMGRRVEETMVHLAVEAARKRSRQRVVAELRPTAKNKPCLTFLEESKLRSENGMTFVWDASEPYPLPGVIALHVTG